MKPMMLMREELQAWIFRDAGLVTESQSAAELAWQEALQRREERPDDPSPILALARLRAFAGDNGAAGELARESTQAAQSVAADQNQYARYRLMYSHTLCVAGELDSVENLWREILDEDSGWTLASLVSRWPPCKKLITDTEHYRRLEAEFGHLSEGVSVTQN